MLAAVIGILIALVVVYIIWVDISSPSAAELKRQIKEDEKLLAESRALTDELAAYSDPKPMARSPRKATRKKAPTQGKKLDVVSFDYVNGEGEHSSRRVVVRAIAEEYFEGLDTEKKETRTFRYDRVVGNITSENTGEIVDPYEWVQAWLEASPTTEN